MPTLFDEYQRESLIFLFKGEPGTRKSTCALSFPTPQYWFSWDRKMSSLLLPMKNWGISPRDISYDDYSDWSSAERKLTQFQTNCNYKTLVIDSITTCGDAIMNQAKRLKTGTTRKSGASAGKLVGGIAVNELEDYSAEAAALQDLLSKTKDIWEYHKIHIILIAHVIQSEYHNTANAETHISRQIVTAAKKVAPKIPAVVHEAYHFNIERGFDAEAEGSYALLTTHTGGDFARTSLPLPKKIVFGNEPIYSRYIRPAMDELKQQKSEQTEENTRTTTKEGW